MRFCCFYHHHPCRKFLRRWLFFPLLLLAVAANAQQVSLSVKDARMEDVFKEVKKQTGYTFLYTSEEMKNVKPVTASFQNFPMQQALAAIFSGQPLSYSVDDTYVVVKAKQEQAKKDALFIRGKVVDERGDGIQGASVTIKGSGEGVSTNEKGDFELSIKKIEASLLVSSVGYEAAERIVRGNGPVVISLHPFINKLDEAVVIAYGTTTRRLNTGSVATISSETIAGQPVSNPLAAIQGRATGVLVTTQNGLPGGNIKLEIRGKGSITAGTEPLYIVDGVPYSSTPLNQGFVDFIGVNGEISPLNNINPQDIESIEVLKDASATAIYGSRGANGVVLITTKKGKGGKTRVDINLSKGTSGIGQFPKFLNLQQYLQLRREGFTNDGIVPTPANAPELFLWDTTQSTNWAKYHWGGRAQVTNIQANISGGNATTNFLLSGHYRGEGTILQGDENYARAGMHLSLQHKSTDQRFSLQLSANYNSDKSRLVISPTLSGIGLPPHFPLYDGAGNLNWVGTTENPIAMMNRRSKAGNTSLVSNLSLAYRILPGLEVKTSFGYSTTDLNQLLTIPKFTRSPTSPTTSNSAAFGSNRNQSLIIEPQLNYHRAGKGNVIDVLLGSSWQRSLRTGSLIKAADFSNEALMENLAAAGRYEYATSIYNEYKYASVFARVNYSYKLRYLVTASLRRDGSSRFGPGRQFGNFGAVGAGWIFSGEKWFADKFPVFSYAKIRASYGVTGNDQIPDYQYLSTYGNGTLYQGITGLNPSVVANEYFSWETNRKLEGALELGFWKDRLFLTVAYYRNRSGNQLVSYPLPYQSGFASYQANLPALVQNAGCEIEVNAELLKQKNFSWNFSFNFTLAKNTLLDYPNLQASANASRFVIGEDLGIVKGYRFLGVNPATGLAQFDDVNKDGKLSQPQDFVVIGKTSPDYFGGFGQQFKYQHLSLNLFFQFIKQRSRGAEMFPGHSRNQFTTVLQRWQKPGDITGVPRASTVSGTPGATSNANLILSDALFYNASYMRFKTCSFSWEAPTKWAQKTHLERIRLYADGQNLFTLKKNVNLNDPETLQGGIPPLRAIVVGLQITL